MTRSSFSRLVRPLLVKILSSTITGVFESRPASTARSRAVQPGSPKWATLIPTISLGFSFIFAAVFAESMSSTLSSTSDPSIPRPTILRKTKTRVFEASMIFFLKSSKVRQPAPPASTTVVVPANRAVSSGKTEPE